MRRKDTLLVDKERKIKAKKRSKRRRRRGRRNRKQEIPLHLYHHTCCNIEKNALPPSNLLSEGLIDIYHCYKEINTNW